MLGTCRLQIYIQHYTYCNHIVSYCIYSIYIYSKYYIYIDIQLYTSTYSLYSLPKTCTRVGDTHVGLSQHLEHVNPLCFQSFLHQNYTKLLFWSISYFEIHSGAIIHWLNLNVSRFNPNLWVSTRVHTEPDGVKIPSSFRSIVPSCRYHRITWDHWKLYLGLDHF